MTNIEFVYIGLIGGALTAIVVVLLLLRRPARNSGKTSDDGKESK